MSENVTPAVTEYHWICTVQVFGRGGSPVMISYQDGSFTPGPGQTRSEVFHEIFDRVVKRVWRPGDSDPVPLFFSLEPMQLLPGTAEKES